MAERPAFQFYPGDWRGNAKLRRCSLAARGAWVEVLCLLHDADEYGVLRWPLAEIAHAAGAPLKLVRELADKGVLKGADRNADPFEFTPKHAGKEGQTVTLIKASPGPCWYSSRFVRDEWVRERRGSVTRFDADNQPPKIAPKASPKVPIGERQGDGPSFASASALDQELSPLPPQVGARDRGAKVISLATYLKACDEAGTDAVPLDDPVFAYAERVGIPPEFLDLAWAKFCDTFLAGNKRQKSWPQKFRNAVEGNWARIWYLDSEGGYKLTTVGLQAQRDIAGRGLKAA